MQMPYRTFPPMILTAALLAVTTPSRAEYGLNLPQGATPIARDIYGLHMLTMGISTVLLVIVFGSVIFALFKFR